MFAIMNRHGFFSSSAKFFFFFLLFCTNFECLVGFNFYNVSMWFVLGSIYFPIHSKRTNNIHYFDYFRWSVYMASRNQITASHLGEQIFGFYRCSSTQNKPKLKVIHFISFLFSLFLVELLLFLFYWVFRCSRFFQLPQKYPFNLVHWAWFFCSSAGEMSVDAIHLDYNS